MTTMTEAMSVVRRFEELFMEGDFEKVLSVIHEDMVTHEAPSLPYGGDHVGREGWLGLARNFTETWEPTAPIKCDFQDCGPNQVIAFVELDVRARATGKALTLKIAELHRIQDGKIAESTIYYWDTAAILDALRA